MGKLTTHILDVASGKPAAGVVIELHRCTPAREWLLTAVSNADGRCESPLLEGHALLTAEYELVFRIGDYFRAMGPPLTEPPFLDSIPVRFAVADPRENYHVPLLVSPWSYSTYRGS
jgi:5-hydroxyisourate hydrolase